MAKLTTPNVSQLTPQVMGRLMRDIKDAIEKWDLNDGVEAATGSKTHRLGITPGLVIIQVSDDPKMADYEQINPTSVTSTVITYTTAKAYVRVLADL